MQQKCRHGEWSKASKAYEHQRLFDASWMGCLRMTIHERLYQSRLCFGFEHCSSICCRLVMQEAHIQQLQENNKQIQTVPNPSSCQPSINMQLKNWWLANGLPFKEDILASILVCSLYMYTFYEVSPLLSNRKIKHTFLKPVWNLSDNSLGLARAMALIVSVSQRTLYNLTTLVTLVGSNMSPTKAHLKMIFLLPRWDIWVPWRVEPNTFDFRSKFRWILSSLPPISIQIRRNVFACFRPHVCMVH